MLESFFEIGPEGRTRTDTSSLIVDFESTASTNFTTSGVDEGYNTLFLGTVNTENTRLFIFKSLNIFSS